MSPGARAVALALVVAGCGDSLEPSPGPDAPGSLIRVDDEPVGTHCAGGGVAIRSGVDDDGDGVLDADEVETTHYACAGQIWRGDFDAAQWADPVAVAALGQSVIVEGSLTIARSDAVELPRLEVITGAIHVQAAVSTLSLRALRSVGGSIDLWTGSVERFELPALASIGGSLSLSGSARYRALDLSALRSVGQSIQILYDAPVAGLSLPALASVGGDIVFIGDALDLPALTDVGQSLVIHGGITALDGLPRLTHIGGALLLGQAPALARVALPVLARLGSFDTVNQSWHPALTALSMPRLSIVEHDLRVTNAVALTTLDLPTLQWVNGSVELSYLTSLRALSGPLREIGTPLSPGSWTVTHTGLETLDLPGLTYVEGPIRIEANQALRAIRLDAMIAPGTSSRPAAVSIVDNGALRSVSMATVQQGTFAISGSPALDSLDLHGLVSSGALELRGLALRDLSGLAALRGADRIGLQLPALSTLAGLSNLTTVGDLTIEGGGALPSLVGLDHVGSIFGGLSLRNNRGLTDLSALAQVTTLGSPGHPGTLVVLGNRGLRLDGLSGLTSMSGDLDVENDDLTDLSGLDHLAHVGGDLSIARNPSMTSLTGLGGLVGVAGDAMVADQGALTTLAGLGSLRSIGGTLEIGGLPALAHLGVRELSYVGGVVSFSENPALPADEIAAFLHQIGAP